VRHPGVVTIYDAEQIGDLVGLCMEVVPGQTLEQRIEQTGTFEPQKLSTMESRCVTRCLPSMPPGSCTAT
jgi:hypothetical protein